MKLKSIITTSLLTFGAATLTVAPVLFSTKQIENSNVQTQNIDNHAEENLDKERGIVSRYEIKNEQRDINVTWENGNLYDDVDIMWGLDKVQTFKGNGNDFKFISNDGIFSIASRTYLGSGNKIAIRGDIINMNNEVAKIDSHGRYRSEYDDRNSRYNFIYNDSLGTPSLREVPIFGSNKGIGASFEIQLNDLKDPIVNVEKLTSKSTVHMPNVTTNSRVWLNFYPNYSIEDYERLIYNQPITENVGVILMASNRSIGENTKYQNLVTTIPISLIIENGIKENRDAQYVFEEIVRYIEKNPENKAITVVGKNFPEFFVHDNYMKIEMITTADNKLEFIATPTKGAYMWKSSEFNEAYRPTVFDLWHEKNVSFRNIYRSIDGFGNKLRNTYVARKEEYDKKITIDQFLDIIDYVPSEEVNNFNLAAAFLFFQFHNVPQTAFYTMTNLKYDRSLGYVEFNVILSQYYDDNIYYNKPKSFAISIDNLQPNLPSYINVKQIKPSKIDQNNFFEYILDDNEKILLDKLSQFLEFGMFPKGNEFEIKNMQKNLFDCSFTLVTSMYFNGNGEIKKDKEWDFTINFQSSNEWILYTVIGSSAGLILLVLIALFSYRKINKDRWDRR
ncbi:MAG: hypothetical protein ACRC42_01880 [Mycoplasma sp.]